MASRAERPCPAGTLSFLAVCPARPLAPWDSVLSALPRGSGLATTGGGTGGQTVLVRRGQENVLWALGAKRGESSPSSTVQAEMGSPNRRGSHSRRSLRPHEALGLRHWVVALPPLTEAGFPWPDPCREGAAGCHTVLPP